MAAPDIHRHVGRRLRLRRTMMGLTQTRLGNAAHLTCQQVQKYEAGSSAMNACRLYQFSQLLYVPVAYFFDGLEHPRPASSPRGLAGMLAPETQGDHADHRHKPVSDRECLETMKAFQRIKDQPLRVLLAGLASTIAES